MRCPKCRSTDTKVLDTRTAKNETSIRRRRQCLDCDVRFTTVEEVLRGDLLVVKRDGRREDFDRGKMLGGIKKAVQKRPVDLMQMEMLVAHLVAEDQDLVVIQMELVGDQTEILVVIQALQTEVYPFQLYQKTVIQYQHLRVKVVMVVQPEEQELQSQDGIRLV